MKRILVLTAVAGSMLTAKADLLGTPAYYRVMNMNSSRYITLIDNKSNGADFKTSTIESHAILLQKSFDLICHDPASVLYIKQIKGASYEIAGQGMTLDNLVQYDVKVMSRGKDSSTGQTIYWVYGTQSGMTRYLADGNKVGSQTGTVVINSDPYSPNAASAALAKKQCSWFVYPITDDGANYFGVLPTVAASGSHWASMYASFPYAAYSADVEFYYPCDMASTGIVEMKKVEGAVPGGTPVVVKCGSELPTDNRLNIGATSTAKITDNKLKGAYFACTVSGFANYVRYDAATMRVLGKCKDGSVGFVKDATLTMIPANTCYLVVPGWYPDELKCVFSHSEFQAGVDTLEAEGADGQKGKNVYTTTGLLLKKGAGTEDISSLPAGIYIIGGKKVVKR